MANTFHVGDLEVLVLSDGVAKAPATVYYAGTTPEQWEPHKRWLDHQGNIEFPFGCFLIRSGDVRLLIDTGLGQLPFWSFHGGALLPELAEAGVRPEDIDVVFVTHLHVDHCGSVVTEREGVLHPTFPNATYRWTSDEAAFWSSEKPAGHTIQGAISQQEIQDAIADRFQPADDGGVLAPGANVMATPGHTPGHAGVVLSSGDSRAFLLGDAIGCPVQLEEPEWSGIGDMDPKLARRTQEAVLREIEGNASLLGASHFPGLTFGRVLSGEGRRYWQAL